jgi:hypothetical protein
MLPARAFSKPLQVKKTVAKVEHVSAPLKGLSLSSKLTPSDPLSATILDNFNVDENQISIRAGTTLHYTYSSPMPVWCLIPYYGGVNRLAAAINGEIRMLDGTLVKGSFTSNDWHWTSFSNLSATEYTVMVNGSDGVWSWDGATASTAPVPVTVTSLSNTNPAICTVAPADIAKFSDGMIVKIEGGVAPTMDTANGQRLIMSVNSPPNTFQLVGVDLIAGTAPQTTGVIATVPGTGIVKEAVTAPSYATHINPDHFDIVISHMNRLWFADKSNLSVYYLPLQQKTGEVVELPLNAVFRRGGHIRAMYTWTRDGGAGLDDMLVVFSSNGECVMYSGIDPDSDMQLVGIFRFDSPMSKHSIVNYGGELYVLISTGLVPMSTLLKAESEQLGQSDQNIVSAFFKTALAYRSRPGWSVIHNPSSGRMICNMPLGAANSYKQVIRHMPKAIWSTWSGLPARCWAWIDNRVYFGSDDGKVYESHPTYLNDDGNPIRVDVQPSWRNFDSAASKQFKMVLTYVITDGVPKLLIEIRVDYDDSEPTNQPDSVTTAAPGAEWDLATWDAADWAGKQKNWNNWQGVSGLGRHGAPRLVAHVSNCTFAIAGWDVLYEEGNLFG